MISVEGFTAGNTGWAVDLSFAKTSKSGDSREAALGGRANRRKQGRLQALIKRLFPRSAEAASADIVVPPQSAPHDSAQGRIYPLVIAARRAARERGQRA